MKILTVAFVLLFNYLDTLPKLYQVCLVLESAVFYYKYVKPIYFLNHHKDYIERENDR